MKSSGEPSSVTSAMSAASAARPTTKTTCSNIRATAAGAHARDNSGIVTSGGCRTPGREPTTLVMKTFCGDGLLCKPFATTERCFYYGTSSPVSVRRLDGTCVQCVGVRVRNCFYTRVTLTEGNKVTQIMIVTVILMNNIYNISI